MVIDPAPVVDHGTQYGQAAIHDAEDGQAAAAVNQEQDNGEGAAVVNEEAEIDGAQIGTYISNIRKRRRSIHPIVEDLAMIFSSMHI